MTLIDLLALLKRQYLVILVITLATVIAALTVQNLAPEKQTLSQLYAISIRETATTNAFDLTKVSDDFAQTIVGWTKTPTLTDKISAKLGATTSVGGDTQAKQNLILTATYPKAELKEAVSEALTNELQSLVSQYNSASSYKFVATKIGEITGTTKKSSLLVGLAALFGGITLSIAWIICLALISSKVISGCEAESLLGTKIAVRFCSPKSPALKFLEVLLKKIGKNAVLVGADFDPAAIVNKLENKPSAVKIPDQITTIGDTQLIVVVRLDRTSSETLRALKAVSSSKLELVVWG